MRVIAHILIVSMLTLLACRNGSYPPAGVTGDLRRIVSLSPSITQTVIDLGSEDLIVGVTTWHPPMKKKADIVGTIVTPNIEKIVSLQPDIILYSGEDSGVQNIERIRDLGLAACKFKRNTSFDTICENYTALGHMLKKGDLARIKLKNYNHLRTAVRKKLIAQTRGIAEVIGKKELRIAFFVSHRPMIVASGSSFVGGILRETGAINVYEAMTRPFPIVSAESVVKLNPDIIISMAEGPDEFFGEILKGLNVSAIARGNVYYIRPDHIALYTPSDYIESLMDISVIFTMAGGPE